MEKTTDKGEQMTLKGYKHTELGVLPEDWEVVRLGDIGKIVGGGTPSTEDSKYWTQQDGIVWLTPTEIKTKYITESQRQITKKGLEESSAKSLPKNTILITTRATIGDVGIAQVECTTNQGFQSLICSVSLNYEYAYYALQTHQTKKYFMRFACGSTFLELGSKEVRKTKIPLPPLAEQEKIAEILSTWDTQIQNFETLITEKQNLKKGLCQTLLTAKTRLKGFGGDWEVVRLGDVAHYKNGETLEDFIDPKGSFFLITLDSIDIKGKLKTNHKRIEISHNNTLKKGDIVMILSDIAHGNFLGLTGVIPQDNLYVLNQRVGALKVDNKRANSIFLSLLINANQKYFKRMGQGTSQQNLRKGDIEKFIFSLPPLAEQEKIAEILSEGDKEITLLEQKLESLKSQKKGLMQKLLGGKIRINFKG